jgi:hypothetical protein
MPKGGDAECPKAGKWNACRLEKRNACRLECGVLGGWISEVKQWKLNMGLSIKLSLGQSGKRIA